MKLLKPAEINLGMRKKLAIINFHTSDFITNLGGHREYYYNNYNISDKIIRDLLNEEGYTVIERNQLSNLYSEQNLAKEGFLDSNSSTKMGQMLGAEAIITGNVDFSIKDESDNSYTEHKFDDGVVIKYKQGKATRRYNFYLNYRVIDAITGKILGSKQINYNGSDSTEKFPMKDSYNYLIRPSKYTSINNDPFAKKPSTISNDPFAKPSSIPYQNKIQPDSYYFSQMQFSNYKEKLNSLDSYDSIVSKAFSALSDKLLFQIIPHYITQDREIKGGNNSSMNDAVNYVNKGDWASAITIWNAVIQQSSNFGSNFDKTDYGNSLYNMATYYELISDLDNAENYFQKAYNTTNEAQYYEHINRIRARKKEIGILSSQGFDNHSSSQVQKVEVPTQQNNNQNYLETALKYHSQGYLDLAINEYLKELQVNPNNLTAYNNLAIIYYSKQDWDKAELYYQQAIKLDPNEPSKHFNLALVYKMKNKFSDYSYEMKRACILGLNQACN
ncbi:MAG: DUF6340 family protein [Candidatus Sericytochromatia bacterium]